MYDWPYNSANILEKRMEDFIGNPEEHLIELFEFLGCLPLDRDAPHAPAQVFYNRATARLGQRSAHHHYRAGTPGDWRNHFFEELTAGFKTQYNELLIRLGYEDNADW